MDIEEKRKRIKGALIGCAWGDAMGMPTEMMIRENMDLCFLGGITKFEPSSNKDFIGRHFKAGEVTDDTVNTLLVCQTIIDNNGEFETEPYLQSLRNWVQDNSEISQYILGPSTTKALDAISRGTPIEKAGIFGTTNGSAMKVSPIGLISDYHDMKHMVDNVEKLCLPTHNNNIAIAGASVIAACVSYAFRGGRTIDEMWDIAFDATREGNTRGFKLPSASLAFRLETIDTELKIHPEEIPQALETFYGMSMDTIETVPAVLAIVTLANGYPMEAARIAANIAGDTDTVGAISGTICGAMHPEFDEEGIHLLEEVNNLDFDKYADALAELIS